MRTIFFSGMGSTCYVYIAEITRPEDRSLLSLFGPMFVSLGVVIIYISGYLIHWRATSVFSLIFCVFGCLLLVFFPESPVWLNNRGQDIKAAKAMFWFSGKNSAKETKSPKAMEKENGNCQNENSSIRNFFINFIETNSWKPFLIMVSFFFLQNGSGMYQIVFYAVDFIERSGSRVKPHIVSISLAIMRLLMAIVGSLAIKKYSRRTMVMISASGMSISMLFAGLYQFQYKSLDINERPFDFTPHILMLLYILFSVLGVQQLPWCLSGELFPLSLRGVMNGIIPSFGFIMMFFAVKIYSFLLEKFQLYGLMFLFAVFSFITALFGKFILPETHNKSLYEIECIFNTKLKSGSLSDIKTNSNLQNT